jgi:uncharacterized protein YbgA (DUF1722 family)/uncharacterized protein YbbK (DUF523 family)
MVERPTAPIAVAISDCLLGRSVRYDGTDAAAELVQDELAQLFSYQGYCPEVGIGMGVPRPPIGLYLEPDAQPPIIAVRQVDNHSLDFTAALTRYAQQQLPRLSQVSGYILMNNSPSCGLFTVKVRDPQNTAAAPARTGRGVYAAEVTRQLPLLPVEENERLFDPVLRGNFITRVFTYAHWQRLLEVGLSAAALVDFHSRYKYLLMAHSQPHYRQTGQLLSKLEGQLGGQFGPFTQDIAERYIRLLMQGLECPAGRAGHVNVLQHLLGYLNKHATLSQRQTAMTTINSFAAGEVELQEPLRLLHSLLAKHLDVPLLRYAWQQIYFEPYPRPSP